MFNILYSIFQQKNQFDFMKNILSIKLEIVLYGNMHRGEEKGASEIFSDPNFRQTINLVVTTKILRDLMKGILNIPVGTNTHKIHSSWRDLDIDSNTLKGKSLLLGNPTCRAQERDLIQNGWEKYIHPELEPVTS